MTDYTTTTVPPPLPRHKGVYILPNLFTTASLLAAFIGILATFKGNFETCALAILVSALMDGLDGKVARLTNTASEFGIQYDSLADLVAFGVTPAVMIYQFQLLTYNKIGIAISFLFMACSALRLARFNVTTTVTNKRFFTGLPTPAAGCALALLVLVIPFLPDFVMRGYRFLSLIFTGSIAILMVSNIRYASFKEFGFFKARPFKTMAATIILFSLILSEPVLYGFLLMTAYLLSGVIYTYAILPRRISRPEGGTHT